MNSIKTCSQKLCDKTLQQQHLGDIQTRASTLDAGKVVRMVRG
jgi:hypothetical protein